MPYCNLFTYNIGCESHLLKCYLYAQHCENTHLFETNLALNDHTGLMDTYATNVKGLRKIYNAIASTDS